MCTLATLCLLHCPEYQQSGAHLWLLGVYDIIISSPYPANGLFLTAHERAAVLDRQVKASLHGLLQRKAEIEPEEETRRVKSLPSFQHCGITHRRLCL